MCVLWCAEVRCSVTWCGVMNCSVTWCGVVWCGVVWCGVVWYGVAHSSAVTRRGARKCGCVWRTAAMGMSVTCRRRRRRKRRPVRRSRRRRGPSPTRGPLRRPLRRWKRCPPPMWWRWMGFEDSKGSSLMEEAVFWRGNPVYSCQDGEPVPFISAFCISSSILVLNR